MSEPHITFPPSQHNITFPRDFLWGAATAAYQIEGSWNRDGRGESIWDRFSHTKGKTVAGDNGDVACDHYKRMPEDVQLMRKLGLGTYRFSISWPRVIPEGAGTINPKGLDFYDRLVDSLLEADIEPFVTLYHWDLPQALQDRGGWENRDTGDYFADYAALMSRRLGDRVRYWTTLNEPWVICHLGYRTGEHAPGIKNETKCFQVAHNLMVAHGKATQALRAAHAGLEVGIGMYICPPEPASNSAADKKAAKKEWTNHVRWFLDPIFKAHYPPSLFTTGKAPHIEPGDMSVICQKLDFLGVNYYSRQVMTPQGPLSRVPGSEYTEMGWEVQPEALRRLLVSISREYELPGIFITENGAAYKDSVTDDKRVHDIKRLNFIKDHLVQVRLAMEDGVNLRGYFAWSLMDNFEWSFGYTKRFGIVRVDYETQERIIKDSGHWYAAVIRNNGFPGEDAEQPQMVEAGKRSGRE